MSTYEDRIAPPRHRRTIITFTSGYVPTRSQVRDSAAGNMASNGGVLQLRMAHLSGISSPPFQWSGGDATAVPDSVFSRAGFHRVYIRDNCRFKTRDR
jgi:hypothetical protein